jgi:hypothetical protein
MGHSSTDPQAFLIFRIRGSSRFCAVERIRKNLASQPRSGAGRKEEMDKYYLEEQLCELLVTKLLNCLKESGLTGPIGFFIVGENEATMKGLYDLSANGAWELDSNSYNCSYDYAFLPGGFTTPIKLQFFSAGGKADATIDSDSCLVSPIRPLVPTTEGIYVTTRIVIRGGHA